MSRGPQRKGQCRVSAPTASVLLDSLAVQRKIETFAFHLVGDTHANDRVNDLENDQRDDGVVGDNDHDAFDLIDHLARVAFDKAGGAAILGDCKYAGEQRADHAADRVNAKQSSASSTPCIFFRPVTPQ